VITVATDRLLVTGALSQPSAGTANEQAVSKMAKKRIMTIGVCPFAAHSSGSAS
jgi:hypothetical protein